MYDILIIGGGIVGLAAGYKILEKHPGLKLAVLEKESDIATHQTDRNSGVIHSGIYYKPGSDKAINCRKGHGMLIDFCKAENIPYELCGKVIIATEEKELPVMQSIFERGLQNGLPGITILNAQEVKEIEPYCAAISGIWVPQAGIIDFKLVAEKLATLINVAGGKIIKGFKVEKITEKSDRIVIESANNKMEASFAMACAGLYSDHLARIAGLVPLIRSSRSAENFISSLRVQKNMCAD